MIGWKFSEYVPRGEGQSPFERLLQLFQELLLHTSGDVDEALSWLTELHKQHHITDSDYGIADFIKDLEDKGFIKSNKSGEGGNFNPTAKIYNHLITGCCFKSLLF